MRKILSLLASSLIISTGTFAQPSIQSFSPLSGPVGTSVLIKGTGFSILTSGNIVFFGATRASVITSTDTTIEAIVPAGATYQPIAVTTNNVTAYSAQPFLVTFGTGIGTPFTSNSFLAKIDITTGIYPHGVLVADFNLDGKSDLVVSKGSSSTVSVLKNTSTSAEISFATPLELPATGNNHETAASADFDGDGKIDFVITNSINLNSVSVFRNTSTTSNISFAGKLDLPVAGGPYDVAIGDLNGDGKPDLAVANNGSNFISVYKNTSTPGNVSFAARTDLPASTNPYGIAVADLDADNKPELVYTTQGSSSNLSIIKNSSSSNEISFGSPIELAVFSAPFHVTVGDLDGDNKPDIVAASAGSNAVVVKRNTSTQGNLSFSGQQYFFSTGNYPRGVTITDLDGDGKPEVVTANNFGNNVSALRNTSVPGTISFEAAVNYAVNQSPVYIAAGDLDGDARPDLITANSSAANISILKNMMGTNVAPTIISFTPTSGIKGTTVTITGDNFIGATSVKFGGVATTSFTVNSKTSITATVAQGASGEVSVTTGLGMASLGGFVFNGPLINSFSPTIAASGTIVTITGTNFTNVTGVQFGGVPAASFTVNSQTNITAVVSAGASGDVMISTSNGTATLAGFSFSTAAVSGVTITGFTPVSAPIGAIITVTGTGFSSTPAENTVFFGAVKATVTSSNVTSLSVVVPASATYSPITVTANGLTAYSSRSFSTIITNSTAQLSASSFTPVGSFGTGTYPFAVHTSDLDGDGKPELITPNAVGNNISILKNSSIKGNISFQQKIDLATGKDPKRVAIGDLDGDGKPDLVSCNANAGLSGSISIFQNSSAGGNLSFSAKIDIATGDGTTGVAISDLNKDGKPDIVATSGNSGFFSYFQNASTANTLSFNPKRDFSLAFHPGGIVLVDVDNDGRTDVVVVSFIGKISVYRNTSSNGILSLASPIEYSVFSFVSHVSAGDMDGDGKLDFMINNNSHFAFIKNNSEPGFISLGTPQTFAVEVRDVSISDLNGDGKVDLCSGRWLNGKISIFENLTAGSGNILLGNNIEYTTSNFDTFTTIADFDGDGKPDLASANTTANAVTVLRNKIGEPIIAQLSSIAGHKGQTISITGENFSGASVVKFGATEASSFTIVSSNRIDAVVNGGTSGSVSVTTPAGTANYQGFSFIPDIIASGPTSFCSGDSVALVSTASSSNQWYKDGIAINDATSTTYYAKTSGKYTVRATGNSITTSSPSEIPVSVITVTTPTIIMNGDILTSSATIGNQWYLDSNLINGATSSTYQPTTSGNYSVRVMENGCLSKMSIEYRYALAGMINIGSNQFLGMYPNPATSSLTIQGNVNNQNNLVANITDMYGKIVSTEKNILPGHIINISSLTPGYYFVNVYSAENKLLGTLKILKVN